MINFADPKKDYLKFKKEINDSITKTLSSGNYTLGKQTNNFEKNFSKYIGNKYSVAVNSATDAIKISLMTLNIGNGDEVITVSHTALATIAAIIEVGATPVLVDINIDDYTIDTSLLQNALTNKTRAIIPVHIYGQSCNLNAIIHFAKKNKIYIIEDCSQAAGAKYFSKKVGSYGNIGCFSFYPSKNLSAIGDAGLITTNNYKFYKIARSIRQYGWDDKKTPNSNLIGVNSRMDEIQAGILNVKLKYLDQNNELRRKYANIFYEKLKSTLYVLPKNNISSHHVYHLFVIRCKNREKVKKILQKSKIFPGVHYPTPCHKYSGYKKFIKIPKKLTVTEKISKDILSIPAHSGLKKSEILNIVKILNKIN